MRFWTALAQMRGDHRPKVVHPAAHGLVGDRDPALREQILDVTKAECEPEIEPNRLMYDLRREPISGVADFPHALGYSAYVHPTSCRRRDKAFRGVDCLKGEDGKWIEGLTNPRGFVLADKHQRNPKHPNVFSVGVCVAIPPYEATPLAVGMPKTGYMIESMVTATAHNIRDLIAGKAPTHVPSWNAVCLADFGDSGVAFLAIPQIPPRNFNWSGQGYWMDIAKVGFEKYFLRKVHSGSSEPGYERFLLKTIGVERLKRSA